VNGLGDCSKQPTSPDRHTRYELQMAATENVRQLKQSHNSTELIVPRHGVVTLFGYGIQVRVDRGHLILVDGIGPNRRYARLPRVGHGLKRLVVIGSDGVVSLAALRWLSDQKVSFLLLERDGSVLATTGPVRSDVRLRRAQALAHVSGYALRITRELVRQKLSGQELVARNKLLDKTTADSIANFRAELPQAQSIASIRLIEAQAASAYWTAWHTIPLTFPKKDLPRVPEHWRRFGTRISPLSGSPRRAVTPGCALINYLYAIVEAEASLAARVLGMDPSIGVFHVDQPHRESLACDLMEPVRPQVDAYLLEWITSQPLKREWFFEKPDGNARLMASVTEKLSQTAATWARAVAPVAEWVAQALWSSAGRSTNKEPKLPTQLTQRHRSEGRGKQYIPPTIVAPSPQTICQNCGDLTLGGRHCRKCGKEVSGKKLTELAKLGRTVAVSPEAQKKRSDTQHRHEMAKRVWRQSPDGNWKDPKRYDTEIQPRLSMVKIASIASALGVSEPYAADIRAGRRRPHPRHWQELAELVGVAGEIPINSLEPSDWHRKAIVKTSR
jgi:CRISPR-associated protein Cas1